MVEKILKSIWKEVVLFLEVFRYKETSQSLPSWMLLWYRLGDSDSRFSTTV